MLGNEIDVGLPFRLSLAEDIICDTARYSRPNKDESGSTGDPEEKPRYKSCFKYKPIQRFTIVETITIGAILTRTILCVNTTNSCVEAVENLPRDD
jgi:hypothetical protein